MRWLVVARAVLLGINVLLLDTDTTVLQDVYYFVKAEPFARSNLLFAHEPKRIPGKLSTAVVLLKDSLMLPTPICELYRSPLLEADCLYILKATDSRFLALQLCFLPHVGSKQKL